MTAMMMRLCWALLGRGKINDEQTAMYTRAYNSCLKFFIRSMVFCYGMFNIKWKKHKISDYFADYLPYENDTSIKPTVIISNHKSFFDFFILLCLDVSPAFIAKINFKNYPLIGTICTYIQSIYIDKRNESGRKQCLID